MVRNLISNRPYTVFGAMLTGRHPPCLVTDRTMFFFVGQELQCLNKNQMENNSILNNDFAKLMNRNFTILGRRLYSTNLKDVAGLEDA